MKKLNYEIKEVDGKKRAVFGDYGISHYVQKDKSGNEYFHIPNIYCLENGVTLENQLFTDREGMAVKSVFDGYADALLGSSLFGNNSLDPVIFLDRKIAAEMRRKTIAGWKNATWKYGIVIGNIDSFYNGSIVLESKDKVQSIFDENGTPLLFNTRKEAEDVLKELEWEVDSFISNRLCSNKEKDHFFYEELFKDTDKNDILNRVMHWTNVEEENGEFNVDKRFFMRVKEIIQK